MEYQLEFMRADNTMATRHQGNEKFMTIEAAVTIGVAMIATMDAMYGAIWFRVLDDKGNVVAKGPEGDHPKYGPPAA